MEFQGKNTITFYSEEPGDQQREIHVIIAPQTRGKNYAAKNFASEDVMVENIEYEIDLAE